MKKKIQNESDIIVLMTKLQAQLAVLDRKFDAFMTKSLTELAQARVAQVPKPAPAFTQQASSAPAPSRPSRPMYAVVCYDCGKDTEIPFKPSGDRPVYCKECFAKRRSGQGLKPNAEPKPQAVLAPQSAPVAAAAKPSKKPAAKKAPAKKKTVVKKKAKKK